MLHLVFDQSVTTSPITARMALSVMNTMYVPEQLQGSKDVRIIQPGILLQAHGGIEVYQHS